MATEEQPSSAGRHRQGLRTLSPDQIGKASDDTAAQVSRIGLTFLGTAAFCLLSLFSPDSALLGGNDRLNVPFAGPVSFFGFMLLGPTVLIVLRVYLQIYVEHSDRLDRIARRLPLVRAPTLMPLENPLIRGFSGLAFYLLLPLAMALFAWKAAAFPLWGAGLLCVTAAVIAGHAMLALHRVSWRLRGLLSVSVAILVGGAMLGLGSPRRSFDLFHANLSGQWLLGDELNGADLRFANLSHARLISANLRDADLRDADLSDTDLNEANLSGANLHYADLGDAFLTGADLRGADLSAAHLSGADLRGVRNLTQAQLDQACGTEATKLPPGLTVKHCRE
jgi:hypothetical protein